MAQDPATRAPSALIIVSALLLAAALVVVGTYSVVVSDQPQVPSVELESVILPPKSLRNWVEDSTSNLRNDPYLDVPMDRLAGRGRHDVPTKMPVTRSQMELQEAQKNVAESRKAFLPKIQELDEALQKTPKDEKLLAEKKEIDDNLNMASQSLVAMQAKVNEENKDLVQGKARKFNKDRFLGGSDHFVPLHQAKKQLAGEGYGHRYSITDWLSGH